LRAPRNSPIACARAFLVGLVAASFCTGCALLSEAIVPPNGSSESWQYDVVAEEGAHELRVEAWLPRASVAELAVHSGAEPFVQDAELESDGRWRPLARDGARFLAPAQPRVYHLRYRFELARAARALSNVDAAIAWGDVLEAPPSTWLLRPTAAPAGMHYRLHVSTPEGLAFAAGIFQGGEERSPVYEADASTLGVSPYAAFGPFRMRRVEPVQGVAVDLAIVPTPFEASDDAIAGWVRRSAMTIASLFGCFPVSRAMVLVAPAPGREVHHGETMGDGGASIVVELGENADQAALDADWILTHEMTHLVVPSVSQTHHWIEEGLAVYFEPIARARLGLLSPEQVWSAFAREMPVGLPRRRSDGLDGTSNWRRTYWGGALFCLLADLEIRRRTGNRRGLDDALRGVLAEGGSVAEVWPFDRLLDAADAAVGMPVLRPMHDEMGPIGWSVDLPRLFRDMGVRVEGDGVMLVDDAPLASFRRAITERLPEAHPPRGACPRPR
jgi:hypothetical protein